MIDHLQNPKMTDLEEVFGFMIRCDIAEFGEEDSSRDDLEQQWSEIDPQRDAWLYRDAQNRLAGYACVSAAGEGLQQDIYISLEETAPGIEDVLMTACLKRAEEIFSGREALGTQTLRGYATGVNKRLQQGYEKFGFSRHTVHYRMQIDLTGPVAMPEWSQQYRLSAYDPRDELELYNLIESAFKWEGRDSNPISNWRNMVFRGGRYDSNYFLMVRDGDQLVAAALAYNEDVEGWIRQLAVSKEYQGSGLGGLLLRHMFYLFSLEGVRRIALGVASLNEKACRFYERNGMFRSREFIEYRKPID